MYAASDLIDALLGRRVASRIGPPPGEFPPGWRAWLATRKDEATRFLGDSADRFIALLLQRPLRARGGRVAPLTRWQSFAVLWRQQWEAADPGERRMRLLSMGVTVLIHLLLLFLLLWLAYVRLLAPPPAPADGDDIVQVEYIGEGTPLEEGGGPPASELDSPAAIASAAAAASAPQATPMPAPSASAATATAPQPEQEQPAPPVVQQDVQVSERPEPDARFTLPPPTVRSVQPPTPQVRVPALREAVTDVDLPQPPRPTLRVLQPDAVVQPTRTQEPLEQVREVQVPQPLRSPVVTRQANVRETTVRAPALATQVQSLPMPPATTAGTAASPAAIASTDASAQSGNARQTTGNAPAGTAAAPGGAKNAAAGTQPGARSAGAGAQPMAKPGGLPSPLRGDDWGVSDRNRPGGNKGTAGGRNGGVFNPDGSIRMPPSDTFPRDGDTWSQADIDRAGRWLKRPPNDFTPTRFDQYWLPGETLLQEWVRRGIKAFEIPLPGGRMKIVCKVSILQAGGGCGLAPGIDGHFSQPAIARKPPAVPFKRELMDDPSALSPPAPTAPATTPKPEDPAKVP